MWLGCGLGNLGLLETEGTLSWSWRAAWDTRGTLDTQGKLLHWLLYVGFCLTLGCRLVAKPGCWEIGFRQISLKI